MKKEDLVSVIVPVYKTENFICKCIEGILNQTYRNLEILLIDDGSPDNCPSICDGYRKEDSRVKVFHRKNSGPSDARNYALKKVTGEYIIFVDSDDYIEPETVEVALSTLKKYDADVVIWDYIREFEGRSLPKNIFNEDEILFDRDNIETLRRRFFGLYREELKYPEKLESLSVVWGKLYKRSVIDLCPVSFVDTKLIASSEDALWNSYCFRFVNRAVYIKKYFSHYRKYNGGSLTSGYREGLTERWQELYKYFSLYIERLSLGEDYKEALNNRICVNIISLGLNVLSNKDTVFRQRRKELKRILNLPYMKTAYSKFTLKNLKIHYKIFFFFAKYRWVDFLYLMLAIMKFLMNWKG